MRLFILFIAIVTLFSPRSVYAQDLPDYGAIIRDIIKSVPQPAPTLGQAVILPVTVIYDLNSDIISPQLIVTATAEDNRPLGELRLTLDGLTSPLDLSLYMPPRRQTNNSFVMLKARIDSDDGTTLARTASDTLYTNGTAQLRLISQAPTPTTVGAIASLETARGSVTLKDTNGLFQDATLHVELVESGLAGGRGNPVKGKVAVPIDNATLQTGGAIAFALDYGVPMGGFKMPLGLKAYVTDWAGRTTHVMPNREDFTGPDAHYSLTLDRIRTGADVEPFDIITQDDEPATPPAIPPTQIPATSTLPPILNVTGEATFPAFRGLPRGAVLTVELWQRIGGVDTKVMSRRAITLDGLSGDVAFTLPPARAVSDPARIDADLWLGGRITTKEGGVLFETDGQPLTADNQRLTLYPTAQY